MRDISHKKITGFTLLELLAVLLIFGIVMTYTSISIYKNDERKLQTEAKRLASLFRLAREEAILRNTSIAVHINDEEYEFFIKIEEKWHPLEKDNFLRKRKFPILNIHVSSNLHNSTEEFIRIVFGFEPVSEPFKLQLATANNVASIYSNGLGHFEIR